MSDPTVFAGVHNLELLHSYDPCKDVVVDWVICNHCDQSIHANSIDIVIDVSDVHDLPHAVFTLE